MLTCVLVVKRKRKRPGKKLKLLLTAAIVIVFDFLSKFYVRESFSSNQSLPLIKGIFHLTYVKNSGAAFGIFPGKTLFFLAVTLFVLILIGAYFIKVRPQRSLVQISLGMVVGGAAGNLIDRLSQGLVTDFLDFRFWPVFNFADAAVVIGALLLGAEILKKRGIRDESGV